MKFRAGDFLLDDAPGSAGPVEVDGDQIKALIENNQHSTTWEIVDTLEISKSSIENHLYQLGYVDCFDVWVPAKLSGSWGCFLTVFLHMVLYLIIRNVPF